MPEIVDRNPLHNSLITLFPDQRVKNLVPIKDRGLSNTKFHATLENDNSFLVRVNEKISPEMGLKRFHKAAICSQVCETVGLLAPKVVKMGTLDSGEPYSIETWISQGVPADTFEDEADRIVIWKNLAAEAAKLKEADLQGEQDRHNFGFDGDSPTQTWEQHLPDILSALEYNSSLELSSQQKSKLAEMLNCFSSVLYPPRLCHGDLKLDNVLVDPESLKVIAVLDWELARYVPSIVGELATTLEPAVLDVKQYAVPRTLRERDAVLEGFGQEIENLRHDFTIFFASDIVMNLGWYDRTISERIRPDIPVLKERLANYLKGLQPDIVNLKKILA